MGGFLVFRVKLNYNCCVRRGQSCVICLLVNRDWIGGAFSSEAKLCLPGRGVEIPSYCFLGSYSVHSVYDNTLEIKRRRHRVPTWWQFVTMNVLWLFTRPQDEIDACLMAGLLGEIVVIIFRPVSMADKTVGRARVMLILPQNEITDFWGVGPQDQSIRGTHNSEVWKEQCKEAFFLMKRSRTSSKWF